jgi:hypothetical protein
MKLKKIAIAIAASSFGETIHRAMTAFMWRTGMMLYAADPAVAEITRLIEDQGKAVTARFAALERD